MGIDEDRLQKGGNVTILKFERDYRFLSNFHPKVITYEDLVFPSVENAYQASKSEDIEIRKKFQKLTPGEAKHLGGEINLRSDWDNVKDKIMTELLNLKFSFKSDLLHILMDTHDSILVEGNYWHDNYWGVCYCTKCPGKGLNRLGSILMDIRLHYSEMLFW